MTLPPSVQPPADAESLRAALASLVDFFKALRGPIRTRIPPDDASVPALVKRCLDALTCLTMLQREVLARVMDGEATLGPSTPSTNALLRETVFDNPRRVTARVATGRLEALLDSLTDALAYLTSEQLRVTPPNANDLPEYLVLATAGIDQLVDFVYLDLILRCWPNRPIRKVPT